MRGNNYAPRCPLVEALCTGWTTAALPSTGRASSVLLNMVTACHLTARIRHYLHSVTALHATSISTRQHLLHHRRQRTRASMAVAWRPTVRPVHAGSAGSESSAGCRRRTRLRSVQKPRQCSLSFTVPISLFSLLMYSLLYVLCSSHANPELYLSTLIRACAHDHAAAGPYLDQRIVGKMHSKS